MPVPLENNRTIEVQDLLPLLVELFNRTKRPEDVVDGLLDFMRNVKDHGILLAVLRQAVAVRTSPEELLQRLRVWINIS